MPYRRLPNTDQARIRSLKALAAKDDAYDAYHPVVSLKTLTAIRNFLPKFEAAQTYYAECYARQVKAAPAHHKNVYMARLYISHFIQVLNLAVIRHEIRANQRDLYGLASLNNTLPDLSSEAALVQWGRKIIDGEGKRTGQGGIPIYNPTIAKVKVHYDLFVDSYERQKNLQILTNRSLNTLASMRAEADRLILDAWNQVEKYYEDVCPNEKRLNLCRDYGLIYYYRTGEKKTPDTQTKKI